MMLLQTNSYIVPKDKRTEHSRLVARFRQVLARIGCDHFEAYEQVGANWAGDTTGRFVQIMRFRDRKHQQAVQAAERTDPAAQALIKEFCELINFPYQQQQGLFAVGFYTSLLPAPGTRVPPPTPAPAFSPAAAAAIEPSPEPVPARDNGNAIVATEPPIVEGSAPRDMDLDALDELGIEAALDGSSDDLVPDEGSPDGGTQDEVSRNGDSASDRHVEA